MSGLASIRIRNVESHPDAGCRSIAEHVSLWNVEIVVALATANCMGNELSLHEFVIDCMAIHICVLFHVLIAL